MHGSPDPRPWRWTCALVAVVSLLHLAVAGRMELSVDGAHYALYAQQLDWSYFDHPPMVGWLQALILPISHSDLALRVVPITLLALASLTLFHLASRLFPDESPWLPFVAVLLLQGGAAFQLLSLGLAPEAPLLLVALLTATLLLRMTEGASLRHWLLLGLLLGLGGLSKYTAVTLVATTLLLLPRLGGVRALASPGPWLAVVLAAALVAPVVLWNRAHDWVSFAFQIDHGTGGDGWDPAKFLQTQIGQLAAYTPLVYVGGWIALVAAWPRRRERGVAVTYALVLPVLLLFGWNSGHARGLPHWTALGWAGTTPLLAAWILASWRRRRALRVLTYLSAGLAVLGFALLHVLPWMTWNPFPPYKHPMAALYGYRAATAECLRLRDEMAAQPGAAPRVFIHNWSRASRVAWYGQVPVIVLDGRFNQFDMWYGDAEPGDRGILLVWDRDDDRDDCSDLARFETTRPLGELPALVGGKPVGLFRFWACEGYRETP